MKWVSISSSNKNRGPKLLLAQLCRGSLQTSRTTAGKNLCKFYRLWINGDASPFHGLAAVTCPTTPAFSYRSESLSPISVLLELLHHQPNLKKHWNVTSSKPNQFFSSTKRKNKEEVPLLSYKVKNFNSMLDFQTGKNCFKQTNISEIHYGSEAF